LAAGLAKQLGKPTGLRGRAVGSMLNRHNGRTMSCAIDAVAPRGGETVADIGFGGGLGLTLLLDRVGHRGTVHGVDISATMLARAERRFARHRADGRVELNRGSLTDLPLANGTIDAAITVNTIYFVEDIARAFRELVRALSPAGRAVIGIGDPVAMGREPFTEHGFRLRPVDEVAAALETAGCSVEHSRSGEHPHSAHLLLARPT
jgi:SAM-dependent methyltransferase